MKYEVKGESAAVYVDIEDYSDIGSKVQVIITKEDPKKIDIESMDWMT